MKKGLGLNLYPIGLNLLLGEDEQR